jgi:hypothetical protein
MEVLDGLLGGEVVDVPQFGEQQESAVHPLVRALHLGEPCELAVGLVGGVLEQRVAGALDPPAVLAA